jgi:RND family efflux transporter MFP subunit
MTMHEHNNGNHEPHPERGQASAILVPSERDGHKKHSVGLIAIAVVCVAVAIVVYSGIHTRLRAETALTTSTEKSAVRSVTVTYARSGSDAQEIVLPGITQAFTDAPIYARTSGYLEKWYVDIGSHVSKGQLLAEIETPELDQQLQQAQADLKNTQANLQLAQITAARWKHLLETDSVSKQETDQAVSDLSSKEALVSSSEANVRRLLQLQSYERIYAPFDGVITARNTDVGALIAAGDNSAPKELFHLAAINKLRVYVSVPEVYETAVRNGDHAALTLDAFPGQTFIGILVRNSDSIDLTSRTLNVEVDVDNPHGQLLPGAYAFVHLKVPASSGAVTVTANTLLFRSEGLRVGIVRDGRVHLVPVSIGHDYGNSVEVTSGITLQDALVVDPSDSLEDGAAVQVTNGSRKERIK